MLEARGAEMAEALLLGGAAKAAAAREVAATVDRLIYYAGWADKYEQVLGNVNPVASPHFNFTVTEPMGIIGVIAPDEAPLLALVSLIAPGDHERQHRRRARFDRRSPIPRSCSARCSRRAICPAAS